jgi:hypothetical protein
MAPGHRSRWALLVGWMFGPDFGFPWYAAYAAGEFSPPGHDHTNGVTNRIDTGCPEETASLVSVWLQRAVSCAVFGHVGCRGLAVIESSLTQ